MAPQRPTSKNSSRGRPTVQATTYRGHPPRPAAGAPETVDPVWLLKAVGLVILAALVCGYGSLCLLLYQGQWQFILHPKQTTVVPPSIAGAPITLLHFGADESATPQLTGWAIPAGPGARYATITILFLPPGDGSLADTVPSLSLLHDLGVNILAIDYRGYGQSAALHPNQTRMAQDVESAFQYLTGPRGTPERQIVAYGSGVGASLAAHLAAEHPMLAAVILDSPGADPLETILQDPRTQFLPVRALIHDRFPLDGLATLKTPKLLLQPATPNQAFRDAADPKVTVFDLPKPVTPEYGPALTRALARFLDQYVHAA